MGLVVIICALSLTTSLISAWTHAPVMIFHIRVNAAQFGNTGHHFSTELS